MYLDTILNKRSFIKTHKRIFKLKEIITLFISENKGYILIGKHKKNNAYYFGKYDKKNNKYRLLSNIELESDNESKIYNDYMNTSSKFIEEWSRIEKIVMEDPKNGKKQKYEL